MMASNPDLISIDRWNYLVDVGLWPIRTRLDPHAWIQNFKADELPFAERLLNNFMYFSNELVARMFISAFLNISQQVVTSKNNRLTAKREWSDFINKLTVVRVTGEKPNDADSGFLFTRLARDRLRIPEEQIIPPETAIVRLLARPEGHVLFVDDFVGSGDQFIKTWQRIYQLQSKSESFASISNVVRGRVRFFYCPIICTHRGLDCITRACPDVSVCSAHLLDCRYSAVSPDSIIWGNGMKIKGPEFVKEASQRAGIPDTNGDVDDWRGFYKLGLTLSFEHGWPDATLPLFYWDQNGWKPLLRTGGV